MKPWIKILIGVACGFAGGFAAGFFSHKKMNDIQFEEVSEEEMQEIEGLIQNKNKEADIRKSIDEVFDRKTERVDISDEALPEDPDQLRNVLQGKTTYIQADKEKKIEYEKIWNAVKDYSNEENANDIPVEEEFDEGFMEFVKDEDEDGGNAFVTPPHLISLSDYYNDRPEFDKITIDWWKGDNTWTDEREEIIGDIASYVGEIDIVRSFDNPQDGEDPEVRFVRNEQYGTDYEIIKHNRSWKENAGETE